MQIFFKNIDSVQQFTSSLKTHPSLQCNRCFKKIHFISHGFIYKHHSSVNKEAVGKRIICSNRYGHKGCGRAYQLNVAHKLPKRSYACAVLFTFIRLLLAGKAVTDAYRYATGQQQSRHAWRWLKQLKMNIMRYRGYLKVPINHATPADIPRHHRLLLSTLNPVLLATPCPVATFQITQQLAFI